MPPPPRPQAGQRLRLPPLGEAKLARARLAMSRVLGPRIALWRCFRPWVRAWRLQCRAEAYVLRDVREAPGAKLSQAGVDVRPIRGSIVSRWRRPEDLGRARPSVIQRVTLERSLVKLGLLLIERFRRFLRIA